MIEVWVNIAGFSDYQVSTHGRVRTWSKDRKKPLVMKTTLSDSGYPQLSLYGNGVPVRKIVSRLVAEAFHRRTGCRDQVNHIDGNKLNNQFTNLEWTTARENTDHALANNLVPRGERCGKAKLRNQDIWAIRRCRTEGFSYSRLAKKFGISISHVGAIIKKQVWTHI